MNLIKPMLETYLQFLTIKANEKGLTPAPTKVLLALLEENKTKEEVIDNLHISEKTFRSHMNVVYSSFGIEGRGTGKLEKLRATMRKEYHQSNSLASTSTKTSADNRDYLVQQPILHSPEVPQPEEEAQEETASENPDFVGREEAIAGSNLGDEPITISSANLFSHPPTPKNWQGRNPEIQQLTDWFADTSINTIGIQGLSGIGKSWLAAKVYQSKLFESRFWA
ncbi:MAG: hypothetical protein M3O33_18300, partial [Cyanobacteriota bacterium]|nr:hypothetical protein [Cyanobacteriota bacterium]